MNRTIFRKWTVMRIIWLAMGIAIAIGAITEHNYLLLLPAFYFVFGAIANVGCFAQSCGVTYTKEQKEKAAESQYSNIDYKNHES